MLIIVLSAMVCMKQLSVGSYTNLVVGRLGGGDITLLILTMIGFGIRW